MGLLFLLTLVSSLSITVPFFRTALWLAGWSRRFRRWSLFLEDSFLRLLPNRFPSCGFFGQDQTRLVHLQRLPLDLFLEGLILAHFVVFFIFLWALFLCCPLTSDGLRRFLFFFLQYARSVLLLYAQHRGMTFRYGFIMTPPLLAVSVVTVFLHLLRFLLVSSSADPADIRTHNRSATPFFFSS